MKINPLITDFLKYLELKKGRAKATITNYDFYLRRFSNWTKNPSLDKITLKLIRRYQLYLNRLTDHEGKPLKRNTQNYHLIAIRAFLKYLSKQNIKTLAPEKIELAKMPERQVEFLEGDDLKRFLEAPLIKIQNSKFKIQNLEIRQIRDKAILETLFSTGLRVSELANLKQDEINLKKDEFSIQGKGGKRRVVPMAKMAKEWLKKYLDLRQDSSPYLFVRHDRLAQKPQANLTPRSIQRLVEKYAKIAGLSKHITPHTMRHSHATDLLQSGVDLRSLQTLLGHASITTTQIYTHITECRLRDVYKAFHAPQPKPPLKERSL